MVRRPGGRNLFGCVYFRSFMGDILSPFYPRSFALPTSQSCISILPSPPIYAVHPFQPMHHLPRASFPIIHHIISSHYISHFSSPVLVTSSNHPSAQHSPNHPSSSSHSPLLPQTHPNAPKQTQFPDPQASTAPQQDAVSPSSTSSSMCSSYSSLAQ